MGRKGYVQMQPQPTKLELFAQACSAVGAALVWLFILIVVGFVVYAFR